MILSKLITANKREAIAAAEIKERATTRKSDAVFATVAEDTFEGSGYAVGMAGGGYRDLRDIVSSGSPKQRMYEFGFPFRV